MDSQEKIDVVDINHAELEDLSSVSGIGPVLAARIIAERPFDTLEDLQRVSGIGPRLFEQISVHLTVGAQRSAPEPDEVLVTPAPEPRLRLSAPEMQEAEPEMQPDPWTGTPLNKADEVVVAAETEQEEPEVQEEAAEPIEPSTAEPAVVIPEKQHEVEPLISEMHEGPHAADEPVSSASSSEPEPVVKEKRQPTYTDVTLYAIGFSLLALILGILLTLGILQAINGSLNYASIRQFSALDGNVTALQSQTDTMKQDIQGMRSRLDALEALSGRVSNLESETTSLRNDLKNQEQKLGQMETQITQLKEQTDSLAQRTKVFDNFLNGLKALLNEALPATP